MIVAVDDSGFGAFPQVVVIEITEFPDAVAFVVVDVRRAPPSRLSWLFLPLSVMLDLAG